MPGLLDILRGIGSGAQSGLGAALTPVAMAMAARSGRDPFAVLRSARGEPDPLEQAQLDNYRRQSILSQIDASQSNAGRAFLQANPNAAEQMGFPTDTVGMKTSANYARVPGGVMQPDPASVQTQPVTGLPRMAMLPPRVDTPESVLMDSRLAEMTNQQRAWSLLNGEGGEGGGGLLRDLRMQGVSIDPSTGKLSVQFGRPAVSTIDEGTLGPRGPIAPGEVVGNEQFLVKRSKNLQANRQRIAAIESANNAFQQLYGPSLDAQTGKPVAAGTPGALRVIDMLPSSTERYGMAGGLAELTPGLSSALTRVQGVYGKGPRGSKAYQQSATQRLKSGEGIVVTLVKAMGDAGNIAVPEQDRAIKAFLPQTGDTSETAALKQEITPRILASLLEKLRSAETQFVGMDDAQMTQLTAQYISEAVMEAETAVASQGGPSALPPSTTQTTTPSGSTTTSTLPSSDDLDAARAAFGLGPKKLKKAR